MDKKCYKLIIIFYIIFLILFIFLFSARISTYLLRVELANIKLKKYNPETNTITIEVKRKINKYNDYFECNAKNENNNIYKSVGSNNKCSLTLKLNSKYKIYLTNKIGTISEMINLNDNIDNVLSFKFKSNEIYLIKDEEYKITYYDVTLDKVDYNFKIKDENIAKIKDNKIIGVSPGVTTLYSDKTKETVTITVTDLLTKPYATKDKKKPLPCNIYSEEDNKLLDKILAYKINESGYQTRAGAVAAARFLTLEFPYRIAYFYENGRVHSSGVHYVDGEGRYYKVGLYLNDYKKQDIIAKYRGPAIWGCNLTNLENNAAYGYIPGRLMPNGLDCSGFVSWVLKNAGFDPGDVGAGETEYPYQMTDLGEYTKLTNELISSNKIKVGDLINFWGHIAIIIGIDDSNIYVAESLSYIGGVRAMIYDKKTITKTFTHVVLMDEYYKEDGNLKNMW